MWPFRRNKQENKNIPKVFETIICIPGCWNSWDEFILAIVTTSNGEYIAAGNIIMNAAQQKHYTIEFCERDDKMQQAFMYAGKVTGMTELFVTNIANHKHVVYLSGMTGDVEEAGHFALAATAILKSGGLGVKVETAGKAFEKDKWLKLCEMPNPGCLYEMFVVDSLIDDEGTVFSCGMQNLGYKDTIIDGEDFQAAVSLISLFNIYQIIEKPVILSGQTFTPELGAPKFRITDELQQPYQDESLFGNPFGMWRLSQT